MDWIEFEVPSLETCRRLKELGYPQNKDGLFWWDLDGLKPRPELTLLAKEHIPRGAIRAPLCREMFGYLPLKIKKNGIWYSLEIGFDHIGYVNREFGTPLYAAFIRDLCGLPNRLADMLIWLVENGYLTFS